MHYFKFLFILSVFTLYTSSVFASSCAKYSDLSDDQIKTSLEKDFINEFTQNSSRLKDIGVFELRNRKTGISSFDRSDDGFSFEADINIEEEGPDSFLYFMGVEQEFSADYQTSTYVSTEYTLRFEFKDQLQVDQICKYTFSIEEQTLGLGDFIVDDKDGLYIVRLDQNHNIEVLMQSFGEYEDKKYTFSIYVPLEKQSDAQDLIADKKTSHK